MTDQKQSQFIEVQTLNDSDYVPVFGQGSNRRISKPNLFDQIKDETQIFIYPSTEQLQAAELVADPDWPVYVRNEETEYRLYKITSLAAGVNDISLNNGLTATLQEEYSDIGFVVGPAVSNDGAIALFDGIGGIQLKNGAIPTTIGNAFISAPNSANTGYPKKNPDNTLSMQTANQLKTDLDIDQVSNAGFAGKVTGPNGAVDGFVALFDGITGKLIKTGDSIANYFNAYLAAFLVTLYNIFPRTVANFVSLSSTVATIGQLVNIACHTSGTIGGGTFIGVSSVGLTPDGGNISASGTAGIFWKRVDSSNEVYAENFGAIPDGVTNCTAAILLAITALRGQSQNIYDGLTKQVTAYSSGVVVFGRGVYVITQSMLDFSQDLGLTLKGQGSRGRNKAIHAATTLLITAAGSGFGIRFYGNGAREGHIQDMDLNYSNAGYTGDLFVQTSAPGSYPISCYLGSYGTNGGSYLYSARSCCAISYDEFFYPENCVFDGAQYGILSQDTLQLCSFTGSIGPASTTLTVTAISSGSLGVDLNVYGAGVTAGTRIIAQLTGTPNGIGTYSLTGVAQTIASEAMTADLSFGGSNSNLKDCVFYDITVKSVWHQGNRSRFNFKITGGINNPINVNSTIGVDLRNVHPLHIAGFDSSGSVGNSPTSGWFYFENAEGILHGCKLGIGVSAGAFTNAQIDIRGCTIDAESGFTLNGGIYTKGNNRFSTADKAWICSPSFPTYIDFDPDVFDSGVDYSYFFNPVSNNVSGLVRLNKDLDNSSLKWANQSTGVEFVASGFVNNSTNGSTVISILDSGKTFVALGTGGQTFTIPVPIIGAQYNFVHRSAFSLVIDPTGAVPLYSGAGATKASVSIAGTESGGSITVKAYDSTGWTVTDVTGTWVFA